MEWLEGLHYTASSLHSIVERNGRSYEIRHHPVSERYLEGAYWLWLDRKRVSFSGWMDPFYLRQALLAGRGGYFRREEHT